MLRNNAILGAVNPFSRFQYDVDFVNGTARGAPQPYGNNTADGRQLRDPNNITATFCPTAADGSGNLVSVASSGIRRTVAGQWAYPSGGTSRTLWCRDLTNAVWAVSNSTDVTKTKNQTGADGAANAATLLAATVNNGTVLQSVTLASQAHVFSFDVKRVSGSGTLEATIDGGTTWQAITGITTSYQQKFVYQAAVTNPVFGFRIGTSGDSFAFDFCNTATPSNSMNIPNKYRLSNTSATILSSQSRPSGDIADLSPLITVARGAFAFYWQGRSERPTGGFIITGATNVFCSVDTAGAGGAVKFSNGPGLSKTVDGVWRTGLQYVNRVAGYCSANGRIKMAANGVLGNLDTDCTLETTLDHFDVATNGAGQNSIYGISERFSMSPNMVLSDQELLFLTKG